MGVVHARLEVGAVHQRSRFNLAFEQVTCRSVQHPFGTKKLQQQSPHQPRITPPQKQWPTATLVRSKTETDTPPFVRSSSRQGGSEPALHAAGAVALGCLRFRRVVIWVSRGNHGAVPRGGLVPVVPIVNLSVGRDGLLPLCLLVIS